MARNPTKPTPYRPLLSILLICLLVVRATSLPLGAIVPPNGRGNEWGWTQKSPKTVRFSRFFIPSWPETPHFQTNVPHHISTANVSNPEPPHFSARMPHFGTIVPRYCAIFPQCPISSFFPILGQLGHWFNWDTVDSESEIITPAVALNSIWYNLALQTKPRTCFQLVSRDGNHAESPKHEG